MLLNREIFNKMIQYESYLYKYKLENKSKQYILHSMLPYVDIAQQFEELCKTNPELKKKLKDKMFETYVDIEAKHRIAEQEKLQRELEEKQRFEEAVQQRMEELRK